MKIHIDTVSQNTIFLPTNRKIQIALIIIGILGIVFAGLYAFKRPTSSASTHTNNPDNTHQALETQALKEILNNRDREKLISICKMGINHKALDEIYIETINTHQTVKTNAFKYITNNCVQNGKNITEAITVVENAPPEMVIKHVNEIKWDAKYAKTPFRTNVPRPEFPLQEAFINRFKNTSLANIPHLDDHIPDSIRTLLTN